SLWSAPPSRRMGMSLTKVATMSRLRKLYARCGIGQQTDGYTSHSNGAGISSAARTSTPQRRIWRSWPRQEPLLRRVDGREVLGQSRHARGLHSWGAKEPASVVEKVDRV